MVGTQSNLDRMDGGTCTTQKSIELNIRMYFENFLDNRIATIMDLSLSDFDINPFLIATVRDQLGISTPLDLARWLITQRLERSMVTGFGSTLQNIAKEFSNKKPPQNVTASITRDGKTYNLIIKSGSNHNVQVARNIRQVLLNSKSTEPDSIPVFGICCGDEGDVGTIVKKHMDGIQILSGRRFWDFISQDPECYRKILQIASEVGRIHRDPDAGTLEEAIMKKTKHLESELKKIYGDLDNDFWSNILGDMH